jgi:hypothetical protein
VTAIAMPGGRLRKGLPKLMRSVSTSRSGKKAMSFVEYADPVWQIDAETEPLTRSAAMLFEALDATAGNGMVTVLYTVPKFMNVPQAYWDSPGAAEPADDGNLVSITGNVLSVNGVTNGLTIKSGDLFSLATGEYRSLHRVTVDALAAGGVISLTVEPSVPTYITTGAVVKFKDPELNVRLVPGSMSISDDFRPIASFTLIEVPK